MATVQEMFGRRLSDGSAERRYHITNATSEIDAKNAMGAVSPLTVDGLDREDLQIEEFDGVYYGTALYQSSEDAELETGDSSFSFEVGTNTQKITQSLATINSYAPPSATAPNYKGAINVTDNGADGAEIIFPIYNFSETHIIPAATVTNSYKGTLFNLVGKTNNASFKGLNTGECLATGVSGTRRGTAVDDDWEIIYRYAGSPNVTGLSVGSITGIEKKGWQLLWIKYSEVLDVPSNRLVVQPLAAYVEKVYEEADFSLFGIGTT